MKAITTLSLLTMMGCLPTLGHADDLGPIRQAPAEIKTDKDYNLQLDAGYLLNETKSSDGSRTSKQNLNGSVLFQRMSGAWGQELRAETVNTNDKSSDNNIERYLMAGKVSHHQSATTYQFAKLQWEKDLSSSFDYQASLTGGVGYDFIKTEQQSLSAELGAGYRNSKDSEPPKQDHNEAIGTAAIFYERAVTPSLKFQQDLGYEYGEEAGVFRSKTALSAAINSHFAAQASYQLKQVTATPGNSRDSFVSLGLKYTH